MEEYPNIEEFVEQTLKDKIDRKKNTLIPSILIAVSGVVVILISLRIKCGDASKMCMLSMGIIAALCGIGMLVGACNGHHFVYKKTGAKMKPYKRYLNGSQRQICQSILESIATAEDSSAASNKEADKLLNLTFVPSSDTMLQMLISDDNQYAIVQLLAYIPHTFQPSTHAVVFENESFVAALRSSLSK